MKWKLVCASLLVGLLAYSGSTPVEAKSFSDVKPSHWAYDEIEYLSEKKIISGLPDGSFGTNKPINRAEAASMIMRYFGWDTSGQPDPGYPDLKPGSHWAYNDIAAVHNLGIFAPEGAFQPRKEVTRAEMADMLVKTFDLFSIKGVKFNDVSRDHPAYKAINILAGNNITAGYPDGSFRPDASVTRAEFAVFMSRAMDETFVLEDPLPDATGVIYDLEINDTVIQLEKPLLLQNGWHAPLELYERLGYSVQTLSPTKLILTSPKGLEIEVDTERDEIWVGSTSVLVKEPLKEMDGEYYIKTSGIMEALENPLVFYPNDFIIRLEAPKITNQQIAELAPDAIISAVHDSQPYWKWAKRDRDHLELIRRNNLASSRQQLIHEMNELMNAYYEIHKEIQTVRGLTFVSHTVTGKLDALSRGLKARYLLLEQPKNYEYPEIAKSGYTLLNRENIFSVYTVSDHSFQHLYENEQVLLEEIKSNRELPFELFEGLTIHSIPFTILETEADGKQFAYAGKASGSDTMLIVNATMSTFIHEFGHNWDYLYGDHEEYLKIRGKQGYVPPNGAWEHRVVENFAEDFTTAFLPEKYGEAIYKGAFGKPTEEQTAAIREFVFNQSQLNVSPNKSTITLNGAALLPDVTYSNDGQLLVEGHSNDDVYASIENIETGESQLIELTKQGSNFSQVIQLNQKGTYTISIGGKINTIVLYQ